MGFDRKTFPAWALAGIAATFGAGACGGAIASEPGGPPDGGASPAVVATSQGGNGNTGTSSGSTPQGGNGNTGTSSGSSSTTVSTPQGGNGDAAPPSADVDAFAPDVSAPPEVCAVDALLIDDMTQPATDGPGTSGFWYTYSDRIDPTSCPWAIPTPPPPGSVLPPEGSSFPPSGGPSGGAGMRECSGGGEVLWGAGFGFDFVDQSEACSAGPFAACSASSASGQTDAANLAPSPFDASAHQGVTFWAKSNTSGLAKVNVHFPEKRTSPWGGVCDPCITSGAMACADDYLLSYLVTTTWKQFTVHWKDLATENWSKQNLPKGGMDPSTLYSMRFEFETNSGTRLANFDLVVACIRFVDQ
jgi:hypothetical protein